MQYMFSVQLITLALQKIVIASIDHTLTIIHNGNNTVAACQPLNPCWHNIEIIANIPRLYLPRVELQSASQEGEVRISGSTAAMYSL